MKISPVAVRDLPILWAEVAPLIDKALAYGFGEYELGDIGLALSDGTMQLFVAHVDEQIVAAFVSEVIVYPRKKLFRVTFAGGELMDDWIEPAEQFVREGAERIGADLIGIHGRPGWVKVFKKRLKGYRETVILTKEIRL